MGSHEGEAMMDDLRIRIIKTLFIFIVGIFAGVYAERVKSRPKIEPHAQEVRQADGSLILERNPAELIPTAPLLPSGAIVRRVSVVEVQPTMIEPGRSFELQLTQIETKDGGSRVIASTADGKIIGGADWTTPAAQVPRMPRWEVSAIHGWQDGRGSAWGISVGYARGNLAGSVSLIPGFKMVTVGAGIRW